MAEKEKNKKEFEEWHETTRAAEAEKTSKVIIRSFHYVIPLRIIITYYRYVISIRNIIILESGKTQEAKRS